MFVPADGKPDAPHASADASLEAHVDDGDAQPGPLPTSAWIAITLDHNCQGKRAINDAAQQGPPRNVARPRCPWPADACGLRSDVLNGGSSSSVANNRHGMREGPESPLGANWGGKRQPGSRRVLQPWRVYTSKRVRHVDLGARRFKMSSQHSSGGRTSEAYLVMAQNGWYCPVCAPEMVQHHF